jgi:hypothetical protein
VKILTHPALTLVAVKLSVEKIVKGRRISVSQKPGEPFPNMVAKARPHDPGPYAGLVAETLH